MINLSKLGTDIVIALSVLLILWYIIGAQVNRRRSVALVRWIRDGIEVLGGNPTIRWLSPTSFRIQIEGAAPPFRIVGLLVLLEARELLLLWIVHRVLQRRDMLVIRADLTTQPRTEAEVYRPLPLIHRELKRELGRDVLDVQPLGVEDLRVCSAGSLESIKAARPALGTLAPLLRRLSLRRESPHLIATFALPTSGARPAREVFEGLRELAGLIT